MEKDFSNIQILRRSYQVMDLLTSTDSFNRRFLDANFDHIVFMLFDSFDTHSNSNFHHVIRIFDAMKRLFPAKTMDSLVLQWSDFSQYPRSKIIKIKENGDIDVINPPSISEPQMLILNAIPHLDHPLVQSFLLHIIAMQTFSKNDLNIYHDLIQCISQNLIDESSKLCFII